MTIDKITTYLGWVVAVSTLLYSWYKLRLDTPGAQADLAAKYHAMALNSANNEQAMKTRVDELEARLDQMEKRHAEEIAHLKAELAEEKAYATLMDEWAAEVLTILQSLKITTLRPKPVRKNDA